MTFPPGSIRTIALAFAALAASAASAFSQRYEYVGETEIGHFGASAWIDDVVSMGEETPLTDPDAYDAPAVHAMRVRRATALGLRFTKHFSHRWSGEVRWSYGVSELRRVGPGRGGTLEESSFDRLGIVQFDVGVLFHPVWLAGERLGPFLRAGVGGVAWRPANAFDDRERPLHTRRTAALAAVAGAGVAFYATSDLTFRAAYDASVSNLDRTRLLGLFHPFPSIPDETVRIHRVTVGFSLRFFDTTL